MKDKHERDYTTKPHPFTIDDNYFIRTVTHHFTGKLVAVYDQELVLTTAAWIADDGRFADSMKDGKYAEIEPYPQDKRVVIGRGALIDAHTTDNPLPTKQHPSK